MYKEKRERTGFKHEKTHSLEHEHILSGILKCPVCGGSMYANVNRKKKSDGSYYKDFFYYACKHRIKLDGHHCDYHRQWGQDKVNAAVEETVKKMVNNPKFKAALKAKIGANVDASELKAERESYRKSLQQCIGAKNKLAAQIDALDVTDKHYDRKYQDMQERLSADTIYKVLIQFDKLYDNFTDLEKKKFMQSFIEEVQIYEQPKDNGRFLKSISFAFPVYYNDKEFTTIAFGEDALKEYADNLTKENLVGWDKEITDETVVLMTMK